MSLPGLSLSSAGWPPDPLTAPEAYRGVTGSRMLAYLVDLIAIAFVVGGLHLMLGLLTIISLGLLFPLHLLIIPPIVALLYHSLQLSGPFSATLGMRMMGLRAYVLQDGGKPDFPLALLHTVCFYGTLGLGAGILLLIALFNQRRRTLHDVLAGILILRAPI